VLIKKDDIINKRNEDDAKENTKKNFKIKSEKPNWIE